MPRTFVKFSREVILPAYRKAVVTDGIRDAPADDMRDEFDNLDEILAELADEINEQLEDFTGVFDEWHEEHYADAIETEFEVDVREVTPEDEFNDEIRAAIEENVALVTGLTAEGRKDLERIIFESLNENRSARQVAKEIDERLGINRRRALFIARDQTSKISGTLDKIRQQSFGIEHYIWRHTGDYPENPNARKTHDEVDGKVFRWDTEVPNGLVRPGFEINCRCQAQAHIVL